MSNVPYYDRAARAGVRMGNVELVDGMIHDGLWDVYGQHHMGICAEHCATTQGISRAAAGRVRDRVHPPRHRGGEGGRVQGGDRPGRGRGKKGEKTVVAEDDGPKAAKPDKIPSLKPVFKKDGTVTAANSSSINDGGAAVVLMSAERARKDGRTVLGRVRAWGGAARAPIEFTIAPADAVNATLGKAGLATKDVDLWEINEAFAVVSVANNRLLGLDGKNVNVRGGAVALGHPIGASGARILVTLLYGDEGSGSEARARLALHRRRRGGRAGRRALAPGRHREQGRRVGGRGGPGRPGWCDHHGVRVRAVREPGEPDRRAAPEGRQGPHAHLEQLRDDRPRARRPPQGAADPEDRRVATSGRTRSSSGSTSPASSRSSSCRRGRSPSGSAPAARGSAASTPPPASARRWRRARRRGSSTGREYLLELPLRADFALVWAWKADTWGNLVYRKTTRNFAPMMCSAAKVTIAEAPNVLAAGELDPDVVQTPSIYVKRVVKGEKYEKWIERRTVRPRAK